MCVSMCVCTYIVHISGNTYKLFPFPCAPRTGHDACELELHEAPCHPSMVQVRLCIAKASGKTIGKP